jgi:DNA-binding PadR family transcriptional regulator
MKEYRASTGQQLSAGNFYRELQRLAHTGLVRSASRSAAEDPRRSPYAITSGGERTFDGWLHAASRELTVCCDDELSARVLFLDLLPPRDAALLVASWREDLRLASRRVERTRETALASGRGSGDPGARVRATLLARRLRHLTADLDFVEELRGEVERSSAGTAQRESSSPIGGQTGYVSRNRRRRRTP